MFYQPITAFILSQYFLLYLMRWKYIFLNYLSSNLFNFAGYGEPEHRLYFRRLSQTTQTDVLLGNLDVSGSGKVMLRSLTVQERIRELNLRARMFTDTMLAIQGSSRLSHPRRVVAKSLQV